MITYYYSIKNFVIKKIFSLLPIDGHKISVINETFSCNPKYIILEIIKRNVNVQIFWLTDYKPLEFPNQVTVIKKSSIKAWYLLSTSKVIILNSKGDNLHFFKRKKQYVIQTWHGSFPLKYIEGEIEDMLPDWYVKNSKEDSKITNLIISNYPRMTTIFRNSFWYDGEIYECGLPRNDLYFRNENLKEKIRNKLHISHTKKIILYAPTFRDNGDTQCYNLEYKGLLKILKQKTRNEWTILVRMHPNVLMKENIFDDENIIDVGSYVDIQELNLIADLLITDYSSIIFDFMIQAKPIVLYTPDEDNYIKKCRGLRPEYFMMPFKKYYNNIDLQRGLADINLENSYPCSYYKSLGNIDDGMASSRVVDKILDNVS